MNCLERDYALLIKDARAVVDAEKDMPRLSRYWDGAIETLLSKIYELRWRLDSIDQIKEESE